MQRSCLQIFHPFGGVESLYAHGFWEKEDKRAMKVIKKPLEKIRDSSQLDPGGSDSGLRRRKERMRLCGQPPTWMLRVLGDPVAPILNATNRAPKGLGWGRGLNC